MEDRDQTSHVTESTRVRWRRVIWRGLCRRCPRCGDGRLFKAWYTLEERCDACDLEYESRDGDTWAFMYVTTAGLTGFIIVGMLLLRPPSVFVGRLVVAMTAIVLIFMTLPYRKGVAIAIHFISECVWREDPDVDS